MLNANKLQYVKADTEDSSFKLKSKIIQLNNHKKRDERNLFFDKIKQNSLTTKDYLLIAFCIGIMFISTAFLITFSTEISNWHESRMATWWGKTIYVIGLVLLTIKVSFLIYLWALYQKYKPIQSVEDKDLPMCTVIVPAYNEGYLVYETLLSLADSKYPHDKLQIFAIDDGSKDDTWEWILKAKQLLGDRLSIFKQPKNKGKREALYHGFKNGKGEVFVTVDSDSIVDENTLRNLVSPFVFNEKCGAVAGNVRVLNKEKGMIPKMLNVSFTFSFEFVRSAQSVLGSVLCTPGALAAYRKDAVLNCLEDWMQQTFMGKRSTIGEDRALTNMILKQGLHVMFQKNAYVFTNIPVKYNNLYKMFIRWERSNVRENIMMSKFAFSNFREGAKYGTRILLMMQWVKVLLALPLLAMFVLFVSAYPILFITSSLTGILIFSSIQMLFYAKNYNFAEGFLAYVYSMFYMFSLFWITPYAILTAGKGGWLTRELAVKES